jgi:hypothetical protein
VEWGAERKQRVMFGRSIRFQIDTETLRKHVRVTMTNCNRFGHRLAPSDLDSPLVQRWHQGQRNVWLPAAMGSLVCHGESKARKAGR